MQHSNCYSNVKNIDHSITSLNTGAFYWQNWISFTNSPFLFILSKFPTPPPTYFDPAAYLILPNVQTPRLLGPPVYSGTKSSNNKKFVNYEPERIIWYSKYHVINSHHDFNVGTS